MIKAQVNNLLKKFHENQNIFPAKFDAEFSISKTYLETTKKTKKAQESDSGNWIIEGYASTGDIDTQNSIIAASAISDGANSLQKYNTLLFNHNTMMPIGKILVAEARRDKLFIKCSISKSEPGMWEKVKDGTLSKFSIMGEILEAEEKGIDGRDILVINSLRLFEVSLVSVPANVEAKALNWYVEKSLGAILSHSNKITKDDAYADVPEDNADMEEADKSSVETEHLLSAVDEALKIMDTIVAGLVGEDRDSAVRTVQWFQGIKEKYDPQNNTDPNAEKSIKMEDLIVRKNDKLEKDYVEVLDESTSVDESDATIKKSLPIAAEADEDEMEKIEVAVDAVKDVVKKSAKVEEEKVVVTETVSSEDANLAKSMVGVVKEIKELAKSVVGAVDEVSKKAKEVDSIKEEISKSLVELKDILKSFPVRKSAAPVIDEDEVQRLEKSTLTAVKRRVKNYDQLPPQEQLREFLAEQARG